MLDPMSLTFFFQNMRVSYAQPGTQQWWSKVRHLYPQRVQQLVERDFIGRAVAPGSRVIGAAELDPELR